ncbi:glutamine--fructose-6-phosphate transaminase (isomerizing) [Aestuariivirga litoralis]|uniref:glutamine--fructose-6-phosphate transaminase (isomerizing) n=1 Tax=Aestuariivirga litoralis TaxID=2650924 RepID=UPI0018C7DB6E|nr:glutamine--fructose-6-phosphate transaminase (isomerizing) [Aestuariivirga litoralis]MBG1231421.1 glutamine--fructose-6-phosphate transaminase (isomerizing) [Aestuariivirga litoralis]
MCGIVGILGTKPVALDIVEALRRLEYRGYDSAGVATLEDGAIARRRAPGKLRNLEDKLRSEPLQGTSGIGHTRWATHGVPNETNAHPHIVGDVVLVHNGIIENFAELKEELIQSGAKFETQTDTEVVAHLLAQERAKGTSPIESVRAVLGKLRGAFALAIMFKSEDDLLIGARNGPPLAVGHGQGEMYLGSDAIALAPFTNRITYLEDGDWVVATRKSFQIFDASNRIVIRPISFSQASAMLVDKGNHRHFMAKEIEEQPEVVGHTLAEYIDFGTRTVKVPDKLPFDFAKLDRISITACGTASYAGLAAKYWFEKVARLPTEVDIASEFRYREAPLTKNGLAIVVSQSGETADTLAALRYCKSQGQHTIAIVNVPESTIARESELVIRTYAGPEIGVASTKAFTCQLAALACLALLAGKLRGTLTPELEREYVTALIEAPRHMTEVLKQEKNIAAVAHEISKARDVLFLGRGINYPLALEGALKLKEISYIHAEGYAAGELKHGPIALVDEHVPVIVIAPRDELYEKSISNMEEVAARGGKIVLITDDTAHKQNAHKAFRHIHVPHAHAFISPLIYAIPVQLLAYHAAVFMGTDVDQPRNLAKSVTVE